MKKIVSLVLVVMLMMACMVTTVSAAERGETVSFTFSASGNPGFQTYGAFVNYDSSALELVSITDALGGGMFSGVASTGKAAYLGSADVTGDVALFTATFKVKDDAAFGDYTVSASLDTAANNNRDLVSFAIVGGGVVKVESNEPTEPSTEPSTEPTEPSTEPTEPSTEPTEPSTEPTEPSTEPSEPSTEPSEPVVGPTDDEPKTGDITPHIVLSVAAVIAVAAVAMFVFKRKAA